MRKCLFSIAVLLSIVITTPLHAQLFTLETDTVCPRQPINIISHAPAGATYYWGFCSGYLKDNAQGKNFGAKVSFNLPSDIEVVKQNGKYYGFVVNNGSDSLYRLDYGSDLSDTPKVVNLGSLNNTIPNEASGCHLVYDSASAKYSLFIVGGNTMGSSNITRVDFGTNLTNIPNVNNMGNLFNKLDMPTAIQVLYNKGSWVGFVANTGNDELLRLEFGQQLQQTPVINAIGNIGNLDNVGDMTAVLEATGNWYLAIVSTGSSSFSILSFGNDLINVPIGTNLGSLNNKLFNPSSINYIRDCGHQYFFITNSLNNELVRLDIQDLATAQVQLTSFINPAGFDLPSGISNMVRDHDSLFAFVTNIGNNTISQLKFEQCTNSSVVTSTLQQPKSYTYDQPGTYNIYLLVNEGQPNMQVYCRDITVLPFPGITLSADTILCQHDSATLSVLAPNAYNITWYPDYNIDTTATNTVKVHPEYATYYHAVFAYPNGCVVDTTVFVDVIKNNADAGEDREISDGATTMLGGPGTTIGSEYTYTWGPDETLSSPYQPFVKSTPLADITYYLVVQTTQKGFTCLDIDTVVVKTKCSDLNLPNAFAPADGTPGVARFGLLNKNILKLNFFRIYNRWGQLVFETTNPQESWDGTYNGEPCALGVYMWMADAFCVEGERISKSGNVTLIR